MVFFVSIGVFVSLGVFCLSWCYLSQLVFFASLGVFLTPLLFFFSLDVFVSLVLFVSLRVRRPNRSTNPCKTASNWTAPLRRNNNLDFNIHKIEKELDVLVHDLNTSKVKLHDNLSSNQRKALHDLKRNNDIVIKPADKEGSIVIMNKDNYMKETCTQLHNGCLYQKVDNDPTPTLTNILKLLINEQQPNLQNDFLKLIPFHPRPATFYNIPKVHKLPILMVSTCPSSNPDNFTIEAQRLDINPPGRPIVSGIGTLTEYVSAFVVRELQPLLANIPSYIKDTTDFWNKLSRFNNLPDTKAV